MDASKIEQGVRLILEGMGEDPSREGLLDTPARVARASAELLGGMDADPAELFAVSFEADHHDIVVVRDIPFYSMCEHHLLPFVGKAHVCYIPRDGHVTGLSKIARCVNGYAHRPQLQEQLTSQVADAFVRELDPLGVLVVLEAEHSCMNMRGIRAVGAKTVTSAARGALAEDARRKEAMGLLRVSA